MNATAARPSPARASETSPAERSRLRADLGSLLRERRLARGWGQRDLASAAGCARSLVAMLESGTRRPSESSTRRLAVALCAGAPPVAVAMLDIELQRAAGESLRRWRRRPLSARWQRVYDEAARRLDGDRAPDPAGRLVVGRLLAALSPRWEPPA